jgi:hypothetical protein
MFDGPLKIASNESVDTKAISKLVRTAATDADLMLEPRRDIIKAVEDIVRNQIETWKESGQPIKKMDVKNASKRLVKSLVDALQKKNIEIELAEIPSYGKDPEEQKLELLSEIITDVLDGYLSGHGIRVSSDKKEMVFSSEDKALQYLADITGKKITVGEKQN